MRGVYFVGSSDMNFVKIGHAEVFANRFPVLRTASPYDLKCFGILQGSQRLERLLHRYLSDHRGEGEWFLKEPALAALEEFRDVPPDQLEWVVGERHDAETAAITARARETAETTTAITFDIIERADALYGRPAMKLAMQCKAESVRMAIRRETRPMGYRVWNLLALDDTILDEIFAVYGKRLVDLDPAPVNWTQLGIAAAELSAEILRSTAKGHVSHLDQPKLKALVRRVIAAGQGAA